MNGLAAHQAKDCHEPAKEELQTCFAQKFKRDLQCSATIRNAPVARTETAKKKESQRQRSGLLRALDGPARFAAPTCYSFLQRVCFCVLLIHVYSVLAVRWVY
jgi:hypothetical protein